MCLQSAKIALHKAALNRGGSVLTARAEDAKREQETEKSLEMKKYAEETRHDGKGGKWQISPKEREFVELAAAKMAATDPARLEVLAAQVRGLIQMGAFPMRTSPIVICLPQPP